MAESSLNLVLRLRDEATAGLRQFREGLERTGDAVKKSQREFRRANDGLIALSRSAKQAGFVLAGIGAGGLFAIRNFAGEAISAQAATNSLSVAIANTGGSFAQVAGRVGEVTAALQKKTNFADKEQVAALAMMTTNLGSADLALRALPTALDLAAKTGGSLEQAATSLSTVMSGQSDTVRGLAIDFTGANDPMTRLALVQAQVKGAAEATIDPFRQLGNATSDMKEAIGTALLPVLLPLIGALTAVAEWVGQLPGPVLTVVGAVLAAVTAFALIGGAVGLFLGFLPLLITGIGALSAALLFLAANPVVLIIAAIVALGVAIVLLWKNWDTVWSWLKEKTEGVSNFLKHTPLAGIVLAIELVVAAVRFLADHWEAIWGGILSFTSGVLGVLKGMLNTLLVAPLNLAIRAINGVSGALSAIPGVDIPRLGEIPSFARGGVVPGPVGQPRLIMAHAGETVLPTHRSGAGTVNVVLNNPVIYGELDLERVILRAVRDAATGGGFHALPALR